MFIVFNKEKIYSYCITFVTVTLLFVMAFAVTNQNLNTVLTSGNYIELQNDQNNIEIENNLNKIENNLNKMLKEQ